MKTNFSKGQSVIEYVIIASILILGFLVASLSLSSILKNNIEATRQGFNTEGYYNP